MKVVYWVNVSESSGANSPGCPGSTIQGRTLDTARPYVVCARMRFRRKWNELQLRALLHDGASQNLKKKFQHFILVNTLCSEKNIHSYFLAQLLETLIWMKISGKIANEMVILKGYLYRHNSTQLNSTRQLEQTTVDSVCRSWCHKQKHDWLGCTLFNWVSWVELSCVTINTP